MSRLSIKSRPPPKSAGVSKEKENDGDDDDDEDEDDGDGESTGPNYSSSDEDAEDAEEDKKDEYNDFEGYTIDTLEETLVTTTNEYRRVMKLDDRLRNLHEHGLATYMEIVKNGNEIERLTQLIGDIEYKLEELRQEEDDQDRDADEDDDSKENGSRRRREQEAHLAAMATGRQNRQKRYDVLGSKDRAATGVWGTPGICSNPDDQIMLESWSTVDPAEDVVSILPEKGAPAQGGFCIKRGDLIDSMESTVVYRWIPNDPKQPEYGRPDKKISYYRLPLGMRINQESFDLVADQVPRVQRFQLQHAGQDLMGTERAVSAMHGSLEQIYRLVPLLTVQQFHQKYRKPPPLAKAPSFRPSIAPPAKTTSHAKPVSKTKSKSKSKSPKATRLSTATATATAAAPAIAPTRASAEFCRRFAINPSVNPQTNRKIKIGGPTHKLWVKNCQGL